MPGRLLEALLDAGLVTESQARAAGSSDAAPTGAALVHRLVDSGLDERVLAGFFVSRGLGPMLQAPELARADPALVRRLPAADAWALLAMPLRPSAAGAVVAMADPTDEAAVERLGVLLGGRILPTVAKLSDLRDAIERHFAGGAAPSEHEHAPSGVVLLVQEKGPSADEDIDERSDSTRVSNPAEGHARSRSNTEGEVSLTPHASPKPLPEVARTTSRVDASGVRDSAVDSALSELVRVQTRDEAVEVACQACAGVSRGAAFLALRKGVFRGWDGAGEDLTEAAIRSLWVPASNPSMLNEVLHSGKPFRGPCGDTAADHLFRAALASRGRDVALCPVHVGARLVGVLCIDEPPADTDVVERLAQALGQAFERLIVAQKSGD